MTILINPGQAADPGVPLPLPEQLVEHILPGARWYFHQYDFGFLLRQELREGGYPIYSFRFILNRPATFYINCPTPVTALQATLEGYIPGIIKKDINVQLNAGTISLVYLPAGIHQANLAEGITDSFHIEMGIEHIPELLDDWSRRQEVMERMLEAREHGLLFPRIPLHYLMRESLDRIKKGVQTGVGQRLDLRSRVGDLINYYLGSIEEKNRMELLPDLPNKEVLIKIWQDINADPSIKRFTVNKIAAGYYLHRNSLSRNFKRLFNITLQDYIEQQCMNKASHLLTDTLESLEDIADTLGYSNSSSFRRAFLRVMERQPETYRRDTKFPGKDTEPL